MATLKTSRDIAEQLRVLVPDLPRHCTRIVITLAVDTIPEVVVTFNPELDATTMHSIEREFRIADAITQRYQLIPIGQAVLEASADADPSAIDRDQITAAMKETHDAAVATMTRRLRAAGVQA